MDKHEQDRQEAERIARRAADLGHDPARVARALDLRPEAPVDRQQVVAVEQRAGIAGVLHRLRGRA